MPPGAEVHWGEIGVDFFFFLFYTMVTDATGSSVPVWFMHQDKYGSNWNIQHRGSFPHVFSFSLPLHFILFKAQLSGTVCLCGTTASFVCVCVCMKVYFCVMRRDKRLHPPLRRRIPQRSATRSVWCAFSSFFFFSPSFLFLLLPPSPCSHRWKKGVRRNERDKILIRGGGGEGEGGSDKSKGGG